jgi:alkylated DNA repair dioxygenase AlkB
VFSTRTLELMPAIKFARLEELPSGFVYRDGFLSVAEEAELLGIFRGLNFAAYDYHGHQAKRRIVRYGVNYELNTQEASANVLPIPDYLRAIRGRAAEVAGVPEDQLVHAMVSEYSLGTPIGWHRDAPQFGIVIGISLGSACRMRLKPYAARRALASHRGAEASPELMASHVRDSTPGILSLKLEPRSIYVISGEARSEWQHSIPAVEELRYSITFRTLRSKRKTGAA